MTSSVSCWSACTVPSPPRTCAVRSRCSRSCAARWAARRRDPAGQPGRMIRLAVRVHRAQAELVLADLLELAPGGVEETEVEGETVEYAVYGSAGELPDLPDLR